MFAVDVDCVAVAPHFNVLCKNASMLNQEFGLWISDFYFAGQKLNILGTTAESGVPWQETNIWLQFLVVLYLSNTAIKQQYIFNLTSSLCR